jgi:diaminopimelate decarboxylase
MCTRSASDGIDYAIVDGGTSIASILKCELHQLYRVTDFGARADREYRLAGPISHPGDILASCIRLPRLAAGDVLLIMDSGAYFEPDSTSFSFPRPATLALDKGTVRIIRRAESFADMIHRDEY